MIGKLIGAVVGERVARKSSMDGTGGILLGAAAPALIRRLGPVRLVAMAAVGYGLKRLYDSRQPARAPYGGMGVHP